MDAPILLDYGSGSTNYCSPIANQRIPILSRAL